MPDLSKSATIEARFDQRGALKRKRTCPGWSTRVGNPDLAGLKLGRGLRNELGDEVGFDRLEAAFRAVARVLNAAERHFRQRQRLAGH